MFDIKGIEKLSKAIKKIGDKAEPYLEDAVNDAGNIVLKKAEQKAKGSLKNSMKLKSATKSRGSISSQIII